MISDDNCIDLSHTVEEFNSKLQVEFLSVRGNFVYLKNVDFVDAIVKIPHQTILTAPLTWNKILCPPVLVTTNGIAPLGFQTPEIAIKVGSTDDVLNFTRAVTLSLDGITGQTAYKLSNSTQWILINTCEGLFSSPIPPVFSRECSITDGVDTKILTYHFTEFTKLVSNPSNIETEPFDNTSTSKIDDPESIPSTQPPRGDSNKGSSSGSGRTGVGPESSSGPVLSRGGNSENVIPKWVANVVYWWDDDMVTEHEFKSVITYLLDENIIPNNTPQPDIALTDLAPSVQHIFVLWADNKLTDSSVMGLINYYRSLGVW